MADRKQPEGGADAAGAHACSYTCERPACIKQQRDDLARRAGLSQPPAYDMIDLRMTPDGHYAAVATGAGDKWKQALRRVGEAEMVPVAGGYSLPRWLLESAERIQRYMAAHHPGPWVVMGIQSRDRAAPDFCDAHCTWLDHHRDCPKHAPAAPAGDVVACPDDSDRPACIKQPREELAARPATLPGPGVVSDEAVWICKGREVVVWLRMRPDGTPDWAEDCIGADPDFLDRELAAAGYTVRPLIYGDTLPAPAAQSFEAELNSLREYVEEVRVAYQRQHASGTFRTIGQRLAAIVAAAKGVRRG
jgi:hypothetical protein